IFKSGFLVKLGVVSYAIYMIHQGINYLLHYALLGQQPSVGDWPSVSVTMLSITVVVALSMLSWRQIEKPLISRAHTRYRYSLSSGSAILVNVVPDLSSAEAKADSKV